MLRGHWVKTGSIGPVCYDQLTFAVKLEKGEGLLTTANFEADGVTD